MEHGHEDAIWWHILGRALRETPAVASGRQHAKPERKWDQKLYSATFGGKEGGREGSAP